MKDIEFIPKSQEAEILVPRPKPAREYMPAWFKETPAFENNKMVIDDYGVANKTEKLCMPFSDTLSFGYIQESWCDIQIEIKDGSLSFAVSGGPEMMEARNVDHRNYEGHGFYGFEFAWHIQWAPKVPKGYSVLYTHPLNRYDLPFYSFGAVVDSDKYFYEAAGNYPFLLKDNFSGIIPAGTPLFQIIPFKRDNWKSSSEKFSELNPIKAMVVNRNFWGTYRKQFWTKKSFK